MPVTIASSDRNSYYSAGNVGWSSRCLFMYRTFAEARANSASTGPIGNATTSEMRAQSISVGSNAITVNEVRLAIYKTGTPTDNLSIEIRTDDGTSKPSTTVLESSANVYAGANLTTTFTWGRFLFASGVHLAPSTKYWIVAKRSGAVDASNYFIVRINSPSGYAGGGGSVYDSGAGTWSAEGTTDMMFQVLTEKPSALYCVTQDTSLHMWKSTDWGATWNEQDSANAPTVNATTSPFSACDTVSGPYIGVALFSGANTITCRYFDMSADTWTTSDWGVTPTTTASQNRSIRLSITNDATAASPGAFVITYTQSTDDADLNHGRAATSGATWTNTAGTPFGGSSAERSLTLDTVQDKTAIGASGYTQRFYWQCVGDDVEYRTLQGVTHATAGDVDAATAADVDTEPASSTFEVYQSDTYVDTIVLAYIDSGGALNERIATLQAEPPTFATQNDVSSDTGASGRQLSTCRYRGVNYIVACDGSNLDYHSSSSAGSWSNNLSWVTSLSSAALAQAMSVPGVGVLVAYTDNGDAKVEWLVKEKSYLPPPKPRTSRYSYLRR